MNSSSSDSSLSAIMITRREALKRAAVVLGAALSPSILAGALRAQADSPVAAKARYLSQKQFETLSAISERILPRTDTPGASDVGVPAFIDLMYGEYMTPDETRTLTSGLAEVETLSTVQHKRGFAQLPGTEQDSLLKEIAVASEKKERTFFHLIRELTVVGYFTSEPVGKKVLHYDPIPGRFDACVPLAEVGNVNWTR